MHKFRENDCLTINITIRHLYNLFLFVLSLIASYHSDSERPADIFTIVLNKR